MQLKKNLLFIIILITLSNFVLSNRQVKIELNNPISTESILYTGFPQTNLTYVSPSISALTRYNYYTNSVLTYVSFWTNMYNGTSNTLDKGNFWLQDGFLGMNTTSFSAGTGGRYDCSFFFLNDSYSVISNDKFNILYDKSGCSSGSCNGCDRIILYYNSIYPIYFKLADSCSYAVSTNTTKNFTISGNFTFDRFAVCGGESVNTGNYFALISKINFTFTGLTDNEKSLNKLPEFNISINNNSVICLANNTDSKYISINISSSDFENDTIYFSTNKVNKNTQSYYINFYNEKCLFFGTGCFDYPDYSFLNRVFYDSNTNCEINTSAYPDNRDDNYILYVNDLDKYILSLSNLCIGEKKFEYILENPLLKLYYYTKIYNMGSNDNFNISFFGSSKTTLLDKFVFKRDNTRFLVYSYNETLLLNLTYIEPIEFYIEELFNDTTKINMFNSMNGTAYFNTFATNSSVYMVSLSYNSLNLLIDNFGYTGFLNVLNFSTNIPNNILIDKIGTIVLDVHVTDNIHLGNNYTTKEVLLNVFSCDSFYNTAYVINEPIIVFSEFYNDVCSSSSGLINNLGENTGSREINLCSILYIVYIVLTLIISIAIGGYIYISNGSPDLSFGITGIIFTFAQIATYKIFLFGNIFKIVYGILFAVSCTAIFISFISRKSG